MQLKTMWNIFLVLSLIFYRKLRIVSPHAAGKSSSTAVVSRIDLKHVRGSRALVAINKQTNTHTISYSCTAQIELVCHWLCKILRQSHNMNFFFMFGTIYKIIDLILLNFSWMEYLYKFYEGNLMFFIFSAAIVILTNYVCSLEVEGNNTIKFSYE